MKKFTLMMIALLTVLVVNAAAPVKKVNLQGLRPMVQQNQVPVAMGQVKQAPASLPVQHVHHAAKESRLARPVRPEHREYLACPDLDIYIL